MTLTVVAGGPRVVIAGRPNVGKSALFNRLLGRRAAIVDARPGVTRDRLVGGVSWSGQPRTLIDTGGLEFVGAPGKAPALATAIRGQVEAALADAQLVLLVVDVQSGLTGLDAAFADDLRRRSLPVLVVVNKCDHAAAEQAAVEFSRLGLKWVAVSAAHNRGIDTLCSTIDKMLAGTLPAETVADQDLSAARRLAVVGRPNVGKSSLINALLRQERVLVSDIPGTTRDAVDASLTIPGRPGPLTLVITDTAGLRKPRQMESAAESFSVYQAEKALRQCDVAVLVIEADRPPTARDKRIAALIRDHRRAAMILANKTDRLPDAAMQDARLEIVRCLPFMAHCPIAFVSAHTGRNINVFLASIRRMVGRLEVRIPTGPLNRAVQKAVQRVQPPLIKGTRAKIYYTTQTGNNPLRIVLFVNDPDRLPAAYRLFLEHEIRRQFASRLEGLPILFELRGRQNQTSARTGRRG